MRGRLERHLDTLLGHLDRVAAAPADGPRLSHGDLPPEFTWHDYTIFLLTIAAQVEHSLMVQYLYAGYSLGGPQVPEEHRAMVAGWRQMILGIAKEEMGHLITVQNLLHFLGAPLSLDREDYPWDSKLAPYPFTLEPLTARSLAKYVVLESPKDLKRHLEPAVYERITGLVRDVNKVGVLYELLIAIVGDHGLLPTSALHPETYPTQASWDEWGRGYGKGARGSSVAGTHSTPDVLVMPLASRADALAALGAIAEQGEATKLSEGPDGERSHFERFLAMFERFPAHAARERPADGSGDGRGDDHWDPVRPMPDNPVTFEADPKAGQTQITDPEGSAWASICNIRYRMLLTYLGHTYIVPRGDDHRRGVIVNRMFGEMYHLRSVSSVLVDLPLAADGDMRCGPPFQMPYTLQLPQSDAAYWTLHIDLVQACATLLRRVQDFPDPKRAAYARTLLDLDAAAEVEMALYAGRSRDAAQARGATRAHGAGQKMGVA